MMARMAVMKKARGSPLLGRVTNSAATTAEGTAVLLERLEDRGGLGGRDRDWHFVHHEIVNTEVKHDSIRSFKTAQHQNTQGTQDCRLRQAMTETATCRGHVDDIHLQVVHPSHDSPNYENIAYYATEFVDEMSPRSLSAHSLLHTLMKV